jgi:hypothetical protein
MATTSRLRIGVTGHRVPPKLPEDSEAPLRLLIDRIFATVVEARHERDQAGDIVIVSSLAEGSDRIVAYAGIAAGIKLEAVLPFSRAEYMRDFETKASRVEFEQLLALAANVFELDGAADERPRAYEAAGLFMLANIDVLIAIWDGRSAAGIGGTSEIVSRAMSDGILVVWIEPLHPNTIKVSRPEAAEAKGAAAPPADGFHTADIATAARAIRQTLTRSTR